jgi:hypothetical protein
LPKSHSVMCSKPSRQPPAPNPAMQAGCHCRSWGGLPQRRVSPLSNCCQQSDPPTPSVPPPLSPPTGALPQSRRRCRGCKQLPVRVSEGCKRSPNGRWNIFVQGNISPSRCQCLLLALPPSSTGAVTHHC